MPRKKKTPSAFDADLEVLGKSHKEAMGLLEMYIPIVFGAEKPKPTRRKKEVVLSNAETQKRFREKMKAAGYRRVVTWEKGEKLDPAFKNVKVKIHKNSFMICEKEHNLKMFLSKCLEIMNEQFPKEVCSDLAEFLKVFGFDD